MQEFDAKKHSKATDFKGCINPFVLWEIWYSNKLVSHAPNGGYVYPYSFLSLYLLCRYRLNLNLQLPKKSWQQLFTRTSTVPTSSSSNVISRPKENHRRFRVLFRLVIQQLKDSITLLLLTYLKLYQILGREIYQILGMEILLLVRVFSCHPIPYFL